MGEGIGYKDAENYWTVELKEIDWLTAEFIDAFRNELNYARHIQTLYLNGIEKRAYALKFVENLEIQCRKSHFEKNGLLHRKILDLKSSLKNFVDKIQNMFQKAFGYYNIFQVFFFNIKFFYHF